MLRQPNDAAFLSSLATKSRPPAGLPYNVYIIQMGDASLSRDTSGSAPVTLQNVRCSMLLLLPLSLNCLIEIQL